MIGMIERWGRLGEVSKQRCKSLVYGVECLIRGTAEAVRLHTNYLCCFTVCICCFRIATMSQWNQVRLLLSILVSSILQPTFVDSPDQTNTASRRSGNPSSGCVTSFIVYIHLAHGRLLLLAVTVPRTKSTPFLYSTPSSHCVATTVTLVENKITFLPKCKSSHVHKNMLLQLQRFPTSTIFKHSVVFFRCCCLKRFERSRVGTYLFI